MSAIDRRRFLGTAMTLPLLPGLLRADAPAPPPMNGIDGFALALHGQLRTEPGNIFTSPYSISTALAMTAAGAAGKTLEQMRTVLHQAGDPAKVDESYAKLAKSLADAGKNVQINVANAIWAQTGYPWSDKYKKRVTDAFSAAFNDVNFPADPEAARKKINDWVEQQTKEKIKDLLPAGIIDAATVMVLTNAIYFKADWLTAFDKKLTKDLPFTKLDGSKKDVPLMYRGGKIDYYTDDNVIAVRLPYKGKEISFIGLLPKNAEKFEDFEKTGVKNNINLWLAGLKPANDVKVWLPRFKIESRYVLNDALKTLGMPDAFDSKANFGNMISAPTEKFFISLVIHKAFVDVNEEGTEAAAATGVVMTRGAAPRPEDQKSFRADRPFLFALRHEPTGTILFLGRYSNPI